ncbi:glutamyl-tRNA reductase [Allorhodopirellula solitaria]|uniref:Glutamyl-tRNA reductase n=1 Tax=Allorhodopirellula solitaria TaxID=2527987 RepID=A0A5C5YHG2_9BACT|nr:glutamyl-tRNA reductase [Allorhodopirellula solitaria]TWT74105.1 Glutamyl-tRNA reductase [Allorhodopirellula solitaria]
MTLHMIGCSHHDAAVEVREQLSFSSEHSSQALATFSERFDGAELVVLSTCNRVELYAAGGPFGSGLTASESASGSWSDEQVRTALIEFVAECLQKRAEFVGEHMIVRQGREAVDHLFLVAASLDSMVVGEAQILSQVKQAYDLSNLAGATGPLTHAAFQAANRAAKRVQTETTIHRRRLSVPSVAIGEVVPEVFETLRGKRVVLCGAGEMAEETLRYLKSGGSNDLCIVNRGQERAAALAQVFDAQTAPLDELSDQIVAADLLIGTTSAEEPLVDAATFARLNAQRGGRVLLVLDLAVPRDFEPVIGEEPGVYLYQIDDLQAACNRNRREREKQWPKAKGILDEEVQRFFDVLQQRATGPVIQRLRQRADQVKTAELERLLGKLNGCNDPAITKEIEKSFDRLTNKLLHPPMASLRDDAAAGHSRGLLEALRHLFNLGDDL